MSRTSNKKLSVAKKLVDVCVLTAGRFDLLKKCLASIENQTFKDVNIYILDNGSYIKEKTSNLTLFEKYESKRLQQNTGYPHGMNEVIGMGKAPLVLAITDDVELLPDTLDILVRRMDDKKIGMCGLKLLFPENSIQPNKPAGKVQHIGHAMDVKGMITHPLVGWDADNPKCCISQEVVSVTGAVFMIRRDVFNKAGKFMEGYGLGTWEDADLSFSVRNLGYKVFIDTEAIAYHYVGATAEKLQTGFPLGLNSMIFRARWAGSPMMVYDDWKFW